MAGKTNVRASGSLREDQVARAGMVPLRSQIGGHLPEGWTQRRLTDVCDLNPPKPRADEYCADTQVTFVPMPAVDADCRAITKPQVRAFGEVRKGFTSFRENDVILAKITPCFENGKAALCRGLLNGIGFGSTEFHVLRSNGAVLPEYVYHFTYQDAFLREGEANMTGSVGQKRVPADWVASAAIPLPPLAEQRRIVAKVDELLGRVGAARERLAKVPALLKRFRQSVLAAACSGQLTADWREDHPKLEPARTLLARIAATRRSAQRDQHDNRRKQQAVPNDDIELAEGDIPETWTWCSVEQIATVALGGTPSRKVPQYWGGGIPWVSSGEVANCRIHNTRETISRAGLENSNAKLYPRGTVLIAMIGEGKTRGQTAILDIEAATNQNAAALVFDATGVCPEYVWRWAMGKYERHRSGSRGGNYPALNGHIVRRFRLPLPPLEEQREIVRRVEALFALADKIEARVKAAAARVKKITQAILAKAFRGELVPTEAELARQEGRDYEPASVLLERIKAERQAPSQKEPRSKARRSVSKRRR